jgi:hypothetical protein
MGAFISFSLGGYNASWEFGLWRGCLFGGGFWSMFDEFGYTLVYS